MRTRTALAVGAGLAYLFGTESGRRNLEKAKAWARTTWENPKVQKTVHDVEERVTQVVKEQGAQFTEKVTAAVKEATAQAKAGSAGPQDSTEDPEIVVDADGTVHRPSQA